MIGVHLWYQHVRPGSHNQSEALGESGTVVKDFPGKVSVSLADLYHMSPQNLSMLDGY